MIYELGEHEEARVSDDRGVSVFCVDPGETSGWAWACLGWKELHGGIAEALEKAARHRSGYLLGDTRFACGEVPSTRSYRGESEAAEKLICMMEAYGEMSDRVSSSVVPQITDIVVEDFLLRESTQTRDLLSPVRMNSSIATLAHLHRWRLRWHLQSPSDKSVINDERLRAHGCWIAGAPHARDACRHLILFLRKQMALRTDVTVRPPPRRKQR